MPRRLKIGISACFFYPDPSRAAYAPKTLQYIEQSTAHWVMGGGALPVMVPAPLAVDTQTLAEAAVDVSDYATWLDGLVLHGGSDVWPGSYGETPLDPGWHGDRNRDAYEIALVHAFVKAGKPVFGICRGLQLINVAFGGTLYQDIATQHPQARVHRDAEVYDLHFHALEVVQGSRLQQLLGEQRDAKINSIHHQGIKHLAPDFAVEARCPEDGVIEAIRHTGAAYVAAVQWHPEFHDAAYGTLDDRALRADFFAAAHAAQAA